MLADRHLLIAPAPFTIPDPEHPMAYQIIAHIKNPNQARALVVALKAYGFNPLEQGDGGLPGMPNLFGPEGVPVQVPEDEAADATVLAVDLLREMAASDP